MDSNNGHWQSKVKPLNGVTIVEIANNIDQVNSVEGQFVIATQLMQRSDSETLVKTKEKFYYYDALIHYKRKPEALSTSSGESVQTVNLDGLK